MKNSGANIRLRCDSPLYGSVKLNEPLKYHTGIRAGAQAFLWIEPENIAQLIRLIKDAKKIGISTFTTGEGCNIIIQDKFRQQIFINLNTHVFKKIKFNKTSVKVGAGLSLAMLLHLATKRSLGGCEFLSGIPGTVGGAIFGNAGSCGAAISDIVKEIEVITKTGCIKTLKRKHIKFGYRHSGLRGFVIINATLKLKKKNKKQITALLRQNLINKIEKQDYTAPSAGCIFKNPRNTEASAGELIESCGLKGKILGGAQISTIHSNFIINKKNATVEEILALVDTVKKKVKKQFNIELKEEVRIVQ